MAVKYSRHGERDSLCTILASRLFTITLWMSAVFGNTMRTDLLIFLVRQGAQVIARGLISVLLLDLCAVVSPIIHLLEGLFTIPPPLL
jgi:hypothetical protein